MEAVVALHERDEGPLVPGAKPPQQLRVWFHRWQRIVRRRWPCRRATHDSSPPADRRTQLSNSRRDAFAAGRAGHGDRPERRQRAAGADGELIDDPGLPGLHVKEPAVAAEPRPRFPRRSSCSRARSARRPSRPCTRSPSRCPRWRRRSTGPRGPPSRSPSGRCPAIASCVSTPPATGRTSRPRSVRPRRSARARPGRRRPRTARRSASGFTAGDRDSRPSGRTANTSTSLPFAFVVTSSRDPSGRERHLPGRARERASRPGPEAELPRRAGDRRQATVRDPVSVERPAAKRIQNVRVVPVHRHADREVAARPDDLAQFQPVAEDPEHGHGVAARVDREQQPAGPVVRQRPLRRQCGRPPSR